MKQKQPFSLSLIHENLWDVLWGLLALGIIFSPIALTYQIIAIAIMSVVIGCFYKPIIFAVVEFLILNTLFYGVCLLPIASVYHYTISICILIIFCFLGTKHRKYFSKKIGISL